MASFVMVDGGMLPDIAAVRSSAALIRVSAGVSVGMVKYLCLGRRLVSFLWVEHGLCQIDKLDKLEWER